MKKLLWFWLVLLAGSIPAFPAGLIIIHEEDFWRPVPHIRPPPPRPWPPQSWAPLEVNYVQANVQIKDQIAVTAVEQEFYNPNPRQLEGTFLFPVPKGAGINKFTMEINGKQVEAEMLAADKARNIYEDIVRKLKDPALLEYAGQDLFKVRIFPIEPHAKKRITLSYTQVLKADNGLLQFIYPLNTEKYSAKPLKNVSVKVELDSKRPLKSIYSPSHKVEVKRHGEKQATVGYEATDLKPDSDFQLFFAEEEGEFGVNLLTTKAAGEDGYFLLLVTPGMEIKKNHIMPKDVAFVLDTSGSMAGTKLEQARKALLFCVENLNDNDRFEIIRFSTEVEPLFDKLVDASKENRSRAEKFIQDLKPSGGTAIDDALRKALAARPDRADRPYVVIFLTDGRPTIGNIDENQIANNVAKANQANTRIFCFGLGTDVNTHFLDNIAQETKAFTQYVLPDEDLEIKLSNFFTKIKEPVLANPKLVFPEGMRAAKVYPSPLPDLFKGEQLVVAGRYSGSGKGKLEIQGIVNKETKLFDYNVHFPEASADHDYIPRLWATRRVGYLLDEIRLHGENKELKDEVTELARKYNIVTPYTAYLILEDERHRDVAQQFRTFRPQNSVNDIGMDSSSLRAHYNTLARDQSGGTAIAGARAAESLKRAQSSSAAIANSREEALKGFSYNARVAPPAAAPEPPRSFSVGGGVVGRGSTAVTAPAPNYREFKKESEQYAQQSRFVGGHTFYRNQDQWVDSEIQKKPNAKRVRVQFASAEYFDLLKKNPQAATWLSLGRNVQFLIGDTIYEIYE